MFNEFGELDESNYPLGLIHDVICDKKTDTSDLDITKLWDNTDLHWMMVLIEQEVKDRMMNEFLNEVFDTKSEDNTKRSKRPRKEPEELTKISKRRYRKTK